MSLLDRDYSTGRGYDELAGNAVARGFRDIGHDVGAMTSEFRRALKAAAAKRSAAIHGMGLYDTALAAAGRGWVGLRRLLVWPAGLRRGNPGLWRLWARLVLRRQGWVVCRLTPGLWWRGKVAGQRRPSGCWWRGSAPGGGWAGAAGG